MANVQYGVWDDQKAPSNPEHPDHEADGAGGARALRNSSKNRDTILDAFGGQRDTLIACEKMGRQARVIELDPKYCDVIIRRWQEFTGQQARHEESGRAFDDMAASTTNIRSASESTGLRT